MFKTPAEWAGFSLSGFPNTERGCRKWLLNQGARVPHIPNQGKGGGRLIPFSALPTKARRDYLKKAVANGWELPGSGQPFAVGAPAVEKKTPEEKEALWENFQRLPASTRAKAEKRMQALMHAETLVSDGMNRSQAIFTAAQESGFCFQTVYSWFRKVQGQDSTVWLPLLVSSYVNNAKEAKCSQEAWDFYESDLLRNESPQYQLAFQHTQRAATKNGWVIPCERTMRRRAQQRISRPVWVLSREGEKALDRIFPPQKRDRSIFHALQAVNADGHKFDLFARWPDGEVRRPLMVTIQDLLSGKILAWKVGKTENGDLVRATFADLFEIGIPEDAYLDNGRGFAAKGLTGGAKNRFRFKVQENEIAGLLVSVGCRIHWTIPYSGQSKPIERAFRDLSQSISKHPSCAGAYTGNKPEAKPENYASKAVELDEFLRVVASEIALHNAMGNRRSSVCAGKQSFDDVFIDSFQANSHLIRQATERQKRLFRRVPVKVQANRMHGAISFGGNSYYSEFLCQYAGAKLVAYYDPNDLHGEIDVFTANGTALGSAPCTQPVGFNDKEAAKAHQKMKRHRAKKVKELASLERKLDAAELARELVEVKPVTIPKQAVQAGLFCVQPALVHTQTADEALADDSFIIAAGKLYAAFEARRRNAP